MDNAYTDPLRAELVTLALCKCPDLFPHYLDHLAPTLYPRDSPGWFCLVEFIFHIYKSISRHIIQFTISALNQSLTVEAVASAIVNLCTLSPKMVDPIRRALQVGFILTSVLIYPCLVSRLNLGISKMEVWDVV